MASAKAKEVEEYGWSSLPCDPKLWGGDKDYNKQPVSQLCDEVTVPDSDLVKASMEYVRRELPENTFNHSMRVFYYGMAIAKQQFPEWKFSPETWLLTCLWHDIGTIDKYTQGTFMSFEFYGAILAHGTLREHGCPDAQAESIAEAIIRHQDPVETGSIHTIGLLVQLATQFDNMGYHAGYVHKDTIEDVVKHYPRQNWSKCFSSKIGEEVAAKPWAHSTALEEKFPHDVANNKLMEPYDATM